MVQLQILNKVLNTKDFSIIADNNLTSDYFMEYLPEFTYIKEHIEKYGTTPDQATIVSKFPEFELIEVCETDGYLLDTIREEHLYSKSIPIFNKYTELLKSDANKATEYLLNEIPRLNLNYELGGVDIVKNAKERYQHHLDRKLHVDKWFMSTGLDELDQQIAGISKEEEYMVIFARTNQGKSWILGKMFTHLWETGHNVGYISPEMSAMNIGYRFDTLHGHFSNRGLMNGSNVIDAKEYEKYINDLAEKDNKFIVSTPKDFDRKITVSKLKNYIKKYNLDALAIDGITYMTDERYKRGDNKTTTLTNISEDLITLSVELGVPVIVVVQSNRDGAYDKESEGTPELEHIRDSDGIAQNATKVISIRQTKYGLEIGIKKNRFGAVGGKLLYNWAIDTGEFSFMPSYDDAEPYGVTDMKVQNIRKSYTDKEDVF